MSSHFSAVTDDSGNVFVTFTDAGNLYYNRRDAATSQWLTTPVTLVSADSSPNALPTYAQVSWLGGNQLLIAHNAGVQMRVLKGTTSTTSKSGFRASCWRTTTTSTPPPTTRTRGWRCRHCWARRPWCHCCNSTRATSPSKVANAAAVRGRGDVLAQRGGQLPMSLGSCKPAGDNRSS
jgi:hypothetical protein